MSKIDLNYLCTLIGNLSGVPIRMFRGGKQRHDKLRVQRRHDQNKYDRSFICIWRGNARKLLYVRL